MPIKLSIKLDITSAVKSMMPGLNKKTKILRQLQKFLEADIQQVLNADDYGTSAQILYLKLKVIPSIGSQPEINPQLVYKARSHKIEFPFFVMSGKLVMASSNSDFEYLFVQSIVKSLYIFSTEVKRRAINFNAVKLSEDIAKHYGFALSELW